MIPIAMPQIMPATTIITAARKLSMEAVILISPMCLSRQGSQGDPALYKTLQRKTRRVEVGGLSQCPRRGYELRGPRLPKAIDNRLPKWRS